MPDKIIFKGKEYDSIDDMPPDVRAAYNIITNVFADKDHDGVPDVFEGGNAQIVNLGNVLTTKTSFSQIVYEGKTYSSLDELPPEARAKFDQAMSKLSADANKNGIPDLIEQVKPSLARYSQTFSNANTPPTEPVVAQPVATTNDTRLFLVGIAIVLLLLAIVAILGVAILGPLLFNR